MINKDVYLLNYAANLATQVDPHMVSPNPRVGCIIVKNGKIISDGVHKKFGGNHAEQNAIKNFKYNLKTLKNTTIYITLEPCHHFATKKTSSCTDLLLKIKPKRVVIGALDPRFQGKNIKRLKQAGIKTEYIFNKRCQKLNPFFKHFITKKKPYVTLKVAQTLDGRITNPQKNIYITNQTSLQHVHKMRAQYSTILTTVSTIIADNPRMNCRLQSSLHSISHPDLIIVGNRNNMPKNLKIFDIAPREIYFFDTRNMEKVIIECGKMGIDSIMTECGSRLNTELLSKNLVDEINIFIAPKIFGNQQKFSFHKEINLQKFKSISIKNLEGDFLIKYKK